MGFLLDTNIVSQAGKAKRNANVERWLSSVDDVDLFLSAMTVRELCYGVERARAAGHPKAGEIARGVRSILEVFEGRILPINRFVAERWAALLAVRYKHVDDMCFAATAIVHDLTLVTRNVADMRHCGVPLLDPFQGGEGLV